MRPSREPLFLPFDYGLLGRVVVDPDRPTEHYFDIGIPPKELSISENDCSDLRVFDPKLEQAIRDTMIKTGISCTKYTLHKLSDFLERLSCDPGFHSFQQDACPLGGNLYFVSALIAAPRYTISP